MALFVEKFIETAAKLPDVPVTIWLGDNGEPEETLTFAELESLASGVAAHLTGKLKLKKGDRVVLSFPPGLNFLVTFLAALSQGIIAVPVYPPSPANFKKDSDRLQLISRTAGATMVLTNEMYNKVVTALKWKNFFTGQSGAAETAKWLAVPANLFKKNKKLKLKLGKFTGDDVAFLQFTSGSTGDPKGVMITHTNVSQNVTIMRRNVNMERAMVVSWMPQYHDFGLIAMMLLPLTFGYTAVLMSPLTFLKRPLLWLETITKYKGQITAAPNFAYARCTKAYKALAEAKRPKIDLSNLVFCYNAAEPIRVKTVETFIETFEPLGFNPKAMSPAYGLAEHVVYACATWNGGMRVDDAGFVACGETWRDKDIEIMIMSMEGTTPCADGETGEVWLRSPCKAAGYWGRPDVTKETFMNMFNGKDYLRTGDLAYIKDGELYITGRLKDVIIVAGRNIYPQDIELTVEGVTSEIRPGCTAAFQIYTGLGKGDGPEDHIGIVAEVRKDKYSPEELSAIFQGIRSAVTTNHQVNVVRIVLIKQRTIPKTTSGKIRRSTCRDFVLAGEKLEIIPGGSFEGTEPLTAAAPAAAEGALLARGVEAPAPSGGDAGALGKFRGSFKMLEKSASPKDKLNAEVMDIIAQATGLGLDVLNPDSSLVELGVGSLQAIQIGSDVEDKYGISLDPSLLFSGCSLAELLDEVAKEVAEKEGEAPAATAKPAVEEKLDGLQVASYNQQQMFILDSMATNNQGRVAYSIPFALELRGTLRINALTTALQQLVDRHDALRSRYVFKDQVMLEYAPAGSFEVPFDMTKVTAKPGPDGSVLKDKSVLEAIDEEIQRAFDLVKGPLIRFLLIKAAPDVSVLVANMHHAVSDGWSVRLMLNEVSELYNAVLSGSSAFVPPAPKSYASYAKWQREQAESGAWDEGLAFWRQNLRSPPGHLALPTTSNASAPIDAGPGGFLPVSLPEDVVQQLNLVAAQNQTTLYNVLVAALGALLMRYSGQEDLCIVGPNANRTTPHGITNTIGYFVNTMVLRLTVGKEDRFTQLLAHTREVSKNAAANSHIPFEMVVNEVLGAKATPFPVCLVLQDYRLMNSFKKIEGLECTPFFDINTGTAQFDLSFELVTLPDGSMEGRLNYSTVKFNEEAAARTASHYITMLTSLGTQPEQKLSEVQLLSAAEQGALTKMFFGPMHPEYTTGKLFTEMFEEQAAARPDAVCLIYEGDTMTYKEVNDRCNALAHQLVEMGVTTGTPVGVMLDRSFNLIIAIVATMKAGGSYIPLDPSYPDDRLAIYMEDASAAVLLTIDTHAERAKQLGGAKSTWKTLPLDTFWDSAPIGKVGNLERRANMDSLAYLIFTSGSTGRPKGVMINHVCLCDLVHFNVEHYSLTAEDTTLLSNTINFDAHIMVVFPPLACGAKLALAKPDGHLDAVYMADTLAKYGVTFFDTVPSLALEYFRQPATERMKIKLVTLGGEPLPYELVELIYRNVPKGVKVYNTYGPTEATVTATVLLVPPGIEYMTIGRPEYNFHAYIVDVTDPNNMQPTPVGVPGELLLSGPRLAPGYIGRDDLTQEKFILNPCYKMVEALLPPDMRRFYTKAYRTGDLCRWKENGDIDFMGRIDRQVKIGGVRIELGEVEAALAKIPGIGQIIVQAVPDSTGGKKLVGYVTPGSIDGAAAIAHCRTLLLPAMVPSAIVALDSFPLLPNGKVDTKGLPVPTFEAEIAESYVAPSTELEQKLQEVWTKVLGVKEPIGVTTDFFNAGGTSLKVLRLNAAMQEALGIPAIPASLVFNNTTIRETAAALQDLCAEAGEALPEIQARKWPDATRPLSANQEQMWVLSRVGQASAYNMPAALSLEGPVNTRALQKALNAVAARHEVLRMHYVETTEGLIVGQVSPAANFTVPLKVCPPTPASNLDKELVMEAGTPFDLSKGPLVRAKLFPPMAPATKSVLSITMHHAVGDAWSWGIFLAELAAAYSSAADGIQPALEPLPIQYADYAAWQQQQLAGEVAVKQREYWKKTLAGCPDVIQLPLDRPRPGSPSFVAGVHTAGMGFDLMQRLKVLASNLGVSMQGVLIAALQVVLMRYSGQDDVVIGVPIAGRDMAVTQGLIGYFINTVAIRGIEGEGDTFASMAKAAAGAVVNGLDNSLLPFQQVVEALGVRRQAGINPIFQIMFQYLPDADDLTLTFGGLKASVRGNDRAQAKVDLVVEVDSKGQVQAEYMAEIFEATTVQRIVGAYIAVLRQAADMPEQLATKLQLLTEMDQEMLTKFTSGPIHTEYLEAPLIYQAFENTVKEDPGRPCLVFEGQVLSYKEVDERANTLAHRLQELGVGPDVPVGIMLDRSFDLPTSFIATLKAGGCYVPLDPSYPDDRLAIYMEDASAAVLVTEGKHAERARQLGGANAKWKTIVMEKFWANAAGNFRSDTPTENRAGPDHLAYIEFTSGSTGRPKGVMVYHRGLRDFTCMLRDYYQLGKDDASMLSISVNFDPHVTQTFSVFNSGGRLVIAKPEGHTDAEYMMQLCAEQNVTFFFTVPVLGIEYFKSSHAKDCTKLRCMLYGGEPLPKELVNLTYNESPGKLGSYNTYGPTEATVITTTACCMPDDDMIHIGTPDYNTHGYIVDAHMNAVPVGVPGELLLSGPRLARGYVGRPDLTQEKFITNPFYDTYKGHLPRVLWPYFEVAYRTGDLCRWRADGTIDYMGRIDNQVKINGVRIELGEVEAVLSNAPGVEMAIAKAVPGPGGAKRLVGYVVPGSVKQDAVLAHCKAKLLPASVPSVIMAMEAFPLLPNGKVNVKGLPVPDWSEEAEEEYVAPEGDLEKSLQDIWTKALKRSAPLSVQSDFFSAGGTSLQVFAVKAAMQNALGIPEIPTTLIFNHRTIRATAAALKELVATGGAATAAITPRTWEGATRPLSTNQEQMWLLDRRGLTAAYNMPSAIRFKGNVNVHALQEAFNQVAARHEVLRIHYEEQDDGTVVGVVAPADSFTVPLEVAKLAPGENLGKALLHEAGVAFDLSKGPLLRAKLFPAADGESVLAITMHHALGDAWSYDIFLRELGEAYSAIVQGTKADWPALPIQYADYAAWQREQLAGEEAANQRAYWKATLAGCPDVIQLPQDRPRPVKPTFSSGTYDGTFSPELMQDLKALANKLGVNLQAVLLAALEVMLMRYSGQDDVVVGLPVAGRDMAATQSIMGYFINTVAIRALGSEDDTFTSMTKATAASVLKAMDNSLLPFQDVVDAVGAPRQTGINPIYQVMLQYLPDTEAVNLDFSGLEASLVEGGELATAKLNLVFWVTSKGGIKVDYMAEIFDATTIQRMVSAYELLLRQAVESPDKQVASYQLLSESALHLLTPFVCGILREDYLDEPLIFEAFERTAREDPNRPCLVFEDTMMTYKEVDERANTLAARLQELGVGPDVPVGIMLDRSFDLPTCFIAVIKAGGCYVPLDPSYPDDRLAIYLEDAHAAVLLTEVEHVERATLLGGENANWQTLVVEEFWSALDGKFLSEPPKQNRAGPDNLAYIEFTSGSTGRPKGVMVYHRGLRDFTCMLRDYYQLGKNDASMLSISVNFDPHVTQTFSVFNSGGRLVIARPGAHTDAEYMMQLCAEQDVTFFFTVPVLGIEYFKTEYAKQCTKLRCMLYGGEPLPMELVKLTYNESPNRLGSYNTYGPTEATVITTTALCLPDDELIHIGVPDYNTHAYIVDSHMNAVPVGVPGELLLSGPRLARGYVGRPDLTAEKFIPNPFHKVYKSSLPERLQLYFETAYRTGDLCRWRSDGTIDYLGRIDNQVKINGVRIELGEVETVLSKAPGVEQAIAKAVPGPDGAKRLVGYVVPGDVDKDGILAFCKAKLLPASVPSVITAMDAFPLLPNGKVNVKGMPIPDWGKGMEVEYVEPANKMELELQLIWMEVLGKEEPISVTADFFAIGGTSIKVGIVNAAVRKKLGIQNLSATLLYEAKTIREFAAALRTKSTKLYASPSHIRAQGVTRRKFIPSDKKLIPLLPRTSHLDNEAVARLSAADMYLAERMPYPVPKKYLPYWIYMPLQLILCLTAYMFVPVMISGATTLVLTWYSRSDAKNVKNGYLWWIPLGLAAYMTTLLAMAAFFAIAKWVFLGRMRPGIHPLYGWMHLRWATYQSLHRAVLPWVLWYIYHTRLMSWYFRLLGAHIKGNVRLDTVNVMEPDLISIGANSNIGEGATLRAAFIVPPGFVDEVGCLIFSTTRVGANCNVGRLAVMAAGTRLPDGHSLKPYHAAPQHEAVVKGNMPEYPQFIVQRHMTGLNQFLAGLTFMAISLLQLLPVFIPTVYVILALYNINGDEVLVMLNIAYKKLQDDPGVNAFYPNLVDTAYIKVLLFPLTIIMGICCIAMPAGMLTQMLVVLFWKHLILGKLRPGLHLTGSQWLMFRYAVFKRLLAGWFFMEAKSYFQASHTLGHLNNWLGAKFGRKSYMYDGIIEFDAVTVGDNVLPGGMPCVQCVDADGIIRAVSIGDNVSVGHTAMYAGCKIEEGAVLGNETSVAAGKVIPGGMALQGSLLYSQGAGDDVEAQEEEFKGPKRIKVFGGKRKWMKRVIKPAMYFTQKTLNHAIAWGPGGVAYSAGGIAVGLNGYLAIYSIFAAPVAAFAGLVLSMLLTRISYYLINEDKIYYKGSCSVLNLRYSFMGESGTFRYFKEATDCLLGTPWYAICAKAAGFDVKADALFLAPPAVEKKLFKMGSATLDWDSKTSTHYVERGRFNFKKVNVEDDAWVQLNSRCLAVPHLGHHCRVLPASTILPNEEVEQDSVWGGIPGDPLGTVLKPSVRTKTEEELEEQTIKFVRTVTMASAKSLEAGLEQRAHRMRTLSRQRTRSAPVAAQPTALRLQVLEEEEEEEGADV